MKKQNIAFLGFMGEMLASANRFDYGETPEVNTKKHSQPKEIIPNGCKKFFFGKDGTPVLDKPSDLVFDCVASNKKQALRKFNNWVNLLPVCECKNGLEFSECITRCDRSYFE